MSEVVNNGFFDPFGVLESVGGSGVSGSSGSGSVGDVFDRCVVAAVVLHGRGLPVDVGGIVGVDGGLDVGLVERVVGSALFGEALVERGVPVPGGFVGLSAEQLFVLSSLSELGGARSLAGRLRALGVSSAKWRGWLGQREFREAYRQVFEVGFAGFVGPTLLALGRRAEAGDVQAARLVLELSGRLGGGSGGESERWRRVAEVLLESVQELVEDDDVLRLIGERVSEVGRSGVVDAVVVEGDDDVGVGGV